MKLINNKAQALVEYVLIIALVAIACVGAVALLGGRLKDAITKSSCSLVGEQYVEGKSPGEGYCEGKNE